MSLGTERGRVSKYHRAQAAHGRMLIQRNPEVLELALKEACLL